MQYICFRQFISYNNNLFACSILIQASFHISIMVKKKVGVKMTPRCKFVGKNIVHTRVNKLVQNISEIDLKYYFRSLRRVKCISYHRLCFLFLQLQNHGEKKLGSKWPNGANLVGKISCIHGLKFSYTRFTVILTT